ncbi:ribosomal RNA small subunit methyltransferase A [Candidatus Bathyarchaeota archaeon]|nr:ribosomal RNA small subunit methyltransferase A [Candidatus Bathyarchaeota archaeon]
MRLSRTASKLLREYGYSPSRRLGQYFMVNDYFLSLMSTYAGIQQTEVVLEAGPGLGFLTRCLARDASKVVAVEADSRMISILRNELADLDNVELIAGDILKIALPYFDKIVSNPPFSISSTLLLRILNNPFRMAVFTFQKEFVQRLIASRGEKTYGAMAVVASRLAEVELMDEVPKEAFFPATEVESVIIRIRPKKNRQLVVDSEAFCSVVRALFTKRNRKVRNAIKPLLQPTGLKDTILLGRSEISKYLDKRVRDLKPLDFEVIADALSK